jgi:hypothetical protein
VQCSFFSCQLTMLMKPTDSYPPPPPPTIPPPPPHPFPPPFLSSPQFLQLLAYVLVFGSSCRRFLQWLQLPPEGRSAMWRFYGVFAALVCAGCIFGVVGVGLQLSDSDGVISLLYYFDNARVFNDNNFRAKGPALDVLPIFAAHLVVNSSEFLFFSVAKFFVLYRLSYFIKLGLSNRAVKTFEIIAIAVFSAVTALSFSSLFSSFVASYYYAIAWQKATAHVSGIRSFAEIFNVTGPILEKGNTAITAQHSMMSATIAIGSVSFIVAAALAAHGIRKTFSLEKLRESAEVRKIRNQIYGFWVSVLVSDALEIWCVSSCFLR